MYLIILVILDFTQIYAFSTKNQTLLEIVQNKYLVPKKPKLPRIQSYYYENCGKSINEARQQYKQLDEQQKQELNENYNKHIEQVKSTLDQWEQQYGNLGLRTLSPALMTRQYFIKKYFQNENIFSKEFVQKYNELVEQKRNEYDQQLELNKKAAEQKINEKKQKIEQAQDLLIPNFNNLSIFNVFIKENKKVDKEGGEIFKNLNEEEKQKYKDVAQKLNQENEQRWQVLANKYGYSVEELKSQVKQIQKHQKGKKSKRNEMIEQNIE